MLQTMLLSMLFIIIQNKTDPNLNLSYNKASLYNTEVYRTATQA